MKQGKKATATRLFQDALSSLPQRDPLQSFSLAIEKASPLLKLSSSKRGSKSLQTPIPLNQRQRQRTGILWILQAASANKSKIPFGQKLGLELQGILEGKSAVLDKKRALYQQALANKSNIVMMDRRVS